MVVVVVLVGEEQLAVRGYIWRGGEPCGSGGVQLSSSSLLELISEAPTPPCGSQSGEPCGSGGVQLSSSSLLELISEAPTPPCGSRGGEPCSSGGVQLPSSSMLQLISKVISNMCGSSGSFSTSRYCAIIDVLVVHGKKMPMARMTVRRCPHRQPWCA